MFDDLNSELERAERLQSILISNATGGDAFKIEYRDAFNIDYKALRGEFVKNPATKELVPSFVRRNRDLDQFWSYIQPEFQTYAERRKFIYEEFLPLFDYLEGNNSTPSDSTISDTLKSFDEPGVNTVWSRALERRESDPEGAITAARTLLETVCKHILDEKRVEYNSNKIELHGLYRLVSEELNLSPSQHTEEVFKQILGGCSGIVNGLGTLRNKLGDAHGQGKSPVKPASRHAELAVNLAGSVALFLVATYKANQ